jgi:hypothetical protein
LAVNSWHLNPRKSRFFTAVIYIVNYGSTFIT